MLEKQLKTRQICLFFVSFLTITKLFTLPSTIAGVCFNDLYLASFFNILLDGVTLILLLVLSKNNDKTFYEILEDTLGKIGAKIICAFYVVYFFTKSLLPIIEQKEYIELTLYIPNLSFLYFLPFFIVAIYISAKKLRILGRLSDVLFASSIIGFIVLMALSVPHADFSNLLPFGVNGLKQILSGSFLSLAWFGDTLYFLFFIGNFKRQKKDGKKIFLSYLFSALSVILFMMVFYGIFSSIAFRQKFSLTEISKYTTIINSTGRFDYFAILLLLVSNLVAITLPIFFCCSLVNYIFNLKNRYISPLIINGLVVTLMLSLEEFVFSTQKLVITIFGVFFLLMSNILPVFLLLLNKRRKNENS